VLGVFSSSITLDLCTWLKGCRWLKFSVFGAINEPKNISLTSSKFQLLCNIPLNITGIRCDWINPYLRAILSELLCLLLLRFRHSIDDSAASAASLCRKITTSP
jgi:hypothetical protein